MAYCSPNQTLTFLDSPSFFSTTLHLLSIIVIPTHLFGAYCLLFKTPERMISVKWSLLHLHFWTCFVDLGLSVLTIPFTVLPVIAMYPLGILRFTPIPEEFQAYIMFSAVGAMGVSIAGLFENRYRVLILEDHWWHRASIVWYIMNFTVSFTYFLPVCYHFPKDQMKANEFVREKLSCLSEEVKSARFFVLTQDPNLLLAVGAFQMGIIQMECLIFSRLIRRNFKSYGTKMSSKTLAMQKKLIKTLLLQLFLPFFAIVTPFYYTGTSCLNRYHNQTGNNISIIILSSHGFFSTIAMIVVHLPYREELFRLLGFTRLNVFKPAKSSVVVVTTDVTSRSKL